MTTRLDRIEARVNAILKEGDIAVDDIEVQEALALIRVARIAEAVLDGKIHVLSLERALDPLLEEV